MSAVFDIGLKNSSPATVASHMKSRPPELTSERLKSRLQKFRQHRQKEKEKFLGEFDEFIETMKGQLRRGYPPMKQKLCPTPHYFCLHFSQSKQTPLHYTFCAIGSC